MGTSPRRGWGGGSPAALEVVRLRWQVVRVGSRSQSSCMTRGALGGVATLEWRWGHTEAGANRKGKIHGTRDSDATELR
jgi:hypothetical protein